MALSVGIVGLPNVGKSTLFNAITNAHVDAQNYPFCTIEPNTGVVAIPDARLDVLARMSVSKKITYATITFVDIAGLVKGASKGEGLGNTFLSHIRDVSAIAHVVRCFDDPNVVHVTGCVDPIADIETIALELILADLDMAERMYANAEKKIRHGAAEPDEKLRFSVLARVRTALSENKTARSLQYSDEEEHVLRTMNFLTAKKMMYIANIREDMIGTQHDYVKRVQDYALQHNEECVVICAKVEEEISRLDADEKKEYLQALGITASGLDMIAQKCFSLLGLETFLTTGEKETRAWTISKGDTAPQAAGVIHTDFERGFIRANVVAYDAFVAAGGWKEVKEKGLLKQEGKEYVMRDGDVVEFLFNVTK